MKQNEPDLMGELMNGIGAKRQRPAIKNVFEIDCPGAWLPNGKRF
jgi:hypothetical protein